MKKLTFLFALLCASVMGWAYDIAPNTNFWGEHNFQWQEISGVTPPANVVNVQGHNNFDCLYITFADAGFNRENIEGGEVFTDNGAQAWIKLESFNNMYTDVLFYETNSTTNVRWGLRIYNPNGTNTGGKASANLTITSSASLTLDATISETSQITWTSDNSATPTFASLNTGVATVSETGMITAVGRGTTSITVTQSETNAYYAASKNITVNVNGPIVWDNVGWLGNSNDKYKMVVSPTGANIDVIQWRDDKQGIYVTFPSAVWGDCSLASTDYSTQGAGRWYFLSAFTLQENEFTQVCDGVTYTINVYYADGVTGGAANPHLTLTNPTKSSVLLPKGESVTVTYTSENDAAATVSSPDAYVSISGNVVTAESTGTATVTVSQAEVAGTWNEASASFEVNAFDWSDISFIATSDYKIKSSLPGLSLDNAIINWKGHNSIHLILPDAVGIDCSLTGNFDIEGAGLFIYTDAFTVRQTPFTISWKGNVYDTYVYYNLDETPPTISNVEVTSYTHERAVISITANEAFVSAEVFNNNVSLGTFSPSAGAITLTGLTASTTYNQLTVKVKDAANNVSAAAEIPEFTTSAAPSITPATYNGYCTNGTFFVKYAITRNVYKQLEISANIEWLPEIENASAQIWGGGDHINLSQNGTTFTGTFLNDLTDDDVLSLYFRFEYPLHADALESFSYTVGSEQAVPASIPVGAVVLNKASNTLSVGETDNLTATVYPSFATSAGSITWASSAAGFASVEAGTVTAVAAGSANITATCGGVTSDPCAVTVVGVLEPATFWGNGANNGVAIAYSITRNANHTLTYTVEAQQDKDGFYVRVNDGEFHTAALNEGIYSWTSTATYTDGSVLNGFIYLPFTGGDARVDFSYTVGSESARRYIQMTVVENADNADVLAANDGKVREVTVARSFTAGSLYTLVLPFDVDAELTAEKLPGTLTKLNNSYIKDNGDMRINFVNADAIEAGVPYLYEPSNDVANPVFAGVTVNKNLAPTTPADGLAEYYGIYASTTGADLKLISNAYVLGSDQYLYAATGLRDDQPMKALRGYFVLNFPSAGQGAPKRIAKVVFNSAEEQTATGMESIQSSEISIQKEIENGQLFIIRDGKTYNAQGQVIK